MKRKLATLAAISSSFVLANDKVDICHRTGSEKNPWNQINVSVNAIPAHLSHGDFIVTSDNTCPPTTPIEPPIEPPVIPPVIPPVNPPEQETGKTLDPRYPGLQCENFVPATYLASCLAVDSTKDLQTGSGIVRTNNSNKMTVELFETNALETTVLVDEITFEAKPWSLTPACYGKDKDGNDVVLYYLEDNEHGFAILHYLEGGTARKCELRSR